MSTDRPVYLSADIEGVAGLCHTDETSPRSPFRGDYERARVAMTLDVNAAIAGAFDGGATSMVVNDSHSTMRNVLDDRLDDRACLIRGLIKPSCMLEGVDAAAAAVFLVGYHAMAGVGRGVLSHTLDGGQVHQLSIDGCAVGEIGLAVWLAGSRDVPVTLVTGDEETCAEAVALLGDQVVAVATKRGLDRLAAVCPPPSTVREQIRLGAARAVEISRTARPVAPPPEFDVQIEWRSTTAAAVGSWIPGVTLTTSRVTSFSSQDIHEAVALIQVMLLAANAATSS